MPVGGKLGSRDRYIVSMSFNPDIIRQFSDHCSDFSQHAFRSFAQVGRCRWEKYLIEYMYGYAALVFLETHAVIQVVGGYQVLQLVFQLLVYADLILYIKFFHYRIAMTCSYTAAVSLAENTAHKGDHLLVLAGIHAGNGIENDE